MNYEISKRQARLWSRIGARASFGQAILDLANNDENMIAFSADLGRYSGFGTLVAKGLGNIGVLLPARARSLRTNRVMYTIVQKNVFEVFLVRGTTSS